MIQVTRLTGQPLTVNDELIEFMEKTPETVLTMTDGKKVTVKEGVEEIIEKIIAFRRSAMLPGVKE